MQLRNARLHVREKARFSDGSRLFSFWLGLITGSPELAGSRPDCRAERLQDRNRYHATIEDKLSPARGVSIVEIRLTTDGQALATGAGWVWQGAFFSLRENPCPRGSQAKRGRRALSRASDHSAMAETTAPPVRLILISASNMALAGAKNPPLPGRVGRPLKINAYPDPIFERPTNASAQ